MTLVAYIVSCSLYLLRVCFDLFICFELSDLGCFELGFMVGDSFGPLVFVGLQQFDWLLFGV